MQHRHDDEDDLTEQIRGRYQQTGPTLVSNALNELSHRVIGAAIEVHRHLGPGLLEIVYEDAMCIELSMRGLGFARQVSVPLEYKGHSIAQTRLDLLVEEKLIVELKAVESIAPIHRAQVLTYLRAGGFELGLIINFHVPLLREGVARVLLKKDLAWLRIRGHARRE